MYKKLLITLIFSFVSFLSPYLVPQAYALDVCQNNGFYAHCEKPNDPNDRWVIYPHTRVAGILPGVDTCSYDHTGGYECYPGQTCVDDPPASGAKTNQNPRCVGTPAAGTQLRQATCTCDNPPGQAGGGGKNGYNCKQPDGSTKHDFCSDAKEACNPDPQAANANTPGILCGDANAGSGAQNAQPTAAPTLPPPPSPPCKQWANGQCTTFSTAVGDLATDPGGFVKTVFAVLLSFSGGIALLLIIRAGYRLMTSQGKPESITQGRDQLVAAIVGLVFIIFSFVILETIGFDILHLPGFAH